MARRKFLNTDDVASKSLSSYGSNTWYFFQDFVSQYKGIITHLKLWTGAGGTHYGFYRSDDSYVCLENTTQTTSAGTTEIAINNPFSVDLSEVIQVALQATANNSLKYYSDATNPWEYYYAATLPTTIGSSYGTENRTEAMEAWGYPQPEVTSVNGGSDISGGDTGVTIVGTDLVDFDFSAVNPRAYLCPTSTFGSEVEQTITGTPEDSALEITVNATGLTPGTVYFFVETGIGQFSEPIAVTLSSSGGTATDDTPLSGSFSYSGVTTSDTTSTSDTPQAASFSYAGVDTTVTTASSDTPQPGVYSYSGGNVTSTESTSDSPLSASYSYNGNNVHDTTATSDTPQSGAFGYAGNDITVSSHSSDTPQPGSYTYSGGTVSASHASSDTPLAGVYEYFGATITDGDTGATSDTLLGAVFAYAGGDITDTTSTSDNPQPGAYSYNGENIEGFKTSSDTPLAGSWAYAGEDIISSHSSSDTPLAGMFVYSGLDIPTEISGGIETFEMSECNTFKLYRSTSCLECHDMSLLLSDNNAKIVLRSKS